MCEMCAFSNLLKDLSEYLTGNRQFTGHVIRHHTKKLEQLGEVSFPLKIKNWRRQLVELEKNNEFETILDYLHPGKDLTHQLEALCEKSKSWQLQLESYKIVNNTDVHLYLKRSESFELCLKNVFTLNENYGFQEKIFQTQMQAVLNEDNRTNNLETCKLTELRMILLRNFSNKLLSKLTNVQEDNDIVTQISITMNSQKSDVKTIICGAVTNENGVKDVETTTWQLWNKRKIDMQLMAQHKYGVRIQNQSDYFEKLGRKCVVLEMLQNKPHKNIKISLNDVQAVNKGPSFVFYNCARLAALFKLFESKVEDKTYPELPPIDQIDFSLLNQPEEWELGYVYIIQFPSILAACIQDIEQGQVNPHYLVNFISNMVSIFSVYYRRVKVLTAAKEHLFPVLFARIYLLKALERVLHCSLDLFDIEPVRKM